MIAINLDKKRIQIKHVVHTDYVDDRNTYIELTQLWLNSPWLPDNPPFAFDGIDRCIFMADKWELSETDLHGDILRILL